MLIVIEGATGTGKSTIAGCLAERFGAEVIHRLQPPKGVSPLVWYTDTIRDYIPGYSRSLVLDRWHLSEWVYGPLLRGRSDLTPAAFTAVDELLREKGALLVYTHGLVREIQAGMLARDGKQRFTDVEVASHVRRFEDGLSLTAIPRLNYRFMPLPFAPIWDVETIADHAKRLEWEAAA